MDFQAQKNKHFLTKKLTSAVCASTVWLGLFVAAALQIEMSTQITWKVEEQPDVPDAQLVVVSHAAEERLVEQVPGHVLHHGGVAGEDALGVDHLGIHNKS